MTKRQKPARNHHWVSQCYLKRFAHPVSKSGLLWVYDFKRNKSFKSKPRGVAAKKDFNRVDVPGHPIDVIETAMAPFEAQVDRSLRRVSQDTSYPETNDLNFILNFISLLAVRNPNSREWRRGITQQISEAVMDVVLESKERYETQMKRALADGVIDNILPYAQMKDFNERRDYTFKVSRERQIKEELELHEGILNTIGQRPWTVVRSNPKIGEFVTCDHPVILRPSGPKYFGRPMGFGVRGTSILFPVSKHVLLFSDAGVEKQVMTASTEMVASFNWEVIFAAEPQLYASSESCLFFDPKAMEFIQGNELSDKCPRSESTEEIEN